jgi:transposase
MRSTPKKIDPKVKERCVRQVLEHGPEYLSLTAAAEAVPRRDGLGEETVGCWVVQAQIDGGQR